MKLIKAIEKLQSIYDTYCNCEVLTFNINTLSSKPIIDIKYILKKDFREDLKHEESYINNFNKELHNVLIL